MKQSEYYDPALPAACYAETTDGTLVACFAGVTGYTEITDDLTKCKSARELNESIDVSVAQANALRYGAQSGMWKCEEAHVAYWEKR